MGGHANGFDRTASGKPRNGKADRALPHDDQAEASVLGGIFLKPAMLGRLDSLEVEHFYDLRHRAVFQAMRNLEHAQQPIDVTTVEAEIATQGRLDAVGGVAYLGELAMRVPTADNVVAYAKILRDRHLLRGVMVACGTIAERGYTWSDEPDELLGEALASLQRLEVGYREASEKVPIITVGAAMEELERLSRTPVYDTPFPALNAALGFGGLLAGQIYYVASGTGAMKTSWVAALVQHHAAQGRHALIAFYEMFAAYYCARMSAAMLNSTSNEIIRGHVNPADVLRVLPPQIEFLDSPSLSMLRRGVLRHTRMGRPAPLIVVDYVQLLATQIQTLMTRPDTRMANAMASEGLRLLAKETGAAIMVVSASSRSTGKKLAGDVRKMPPRDLVDAARESGAIEYDGAGVIVLSVSDELDGDENIATMTLAKSRFGEACHLDARADGRTGAWRELGRVERVPRAAKENAPLVAPTAAQGKVREAILRVLRAGPQESRSKIVKLTGKARAAVFSELDVMLDDGSLELSAGMIAVAGLRVEQPSQGAIPGVE